MVKVLLVLQIAKAAKTKLIQGIHQPNLMLNPSASLQLRLL